MLLRSQGGEAAAVGDPERGDRLRVVGCSQFPQVLSVSDPGLRALGPRDETPVPAEPEQGIGAPLLELSHGGALG